MKKNPWKSILGNLLSLFPVLKKIYFSFTLQFLNSIHFSLSFPLLCLLLPIVYSFSPFLSLSSSYLPTFLSVKNISYVLFARHYARVPGIEGIDVKAMVSVQFAHKNLKIILQILYDSARHIILWTQWQFFPGVCGRDLEKGRD